MAPTKTPLTDRTPKSTAVKSGNNARPWSNDSITLVRAAKPVVKKELPPKKDGKSGKKVV